MSEHDKQEQRRSKRVKFSEPIQYQFKNPALFGGSLASDISEGGIKIYINGFIPLQTEMMLSLQLASNRIVECVGKVIWIKKMPLMDRYEAGLEFESNDALVDVKKAIKQFVDTTEE